MAPRHLVVTHCEAADMPRACVILMDSMGREHPINNEFYPHSDTTNGRRNAIRRFCEPSFRADPMLHHLKIIDPSVDDMDPAEIGLTKCDPFIAYGRWVVKRRGDETPPPPPTQPSTDGFGDWWASERDRSFVAWAKWRYYLPRKTKLSTTPKDKSLYCKWSNTGTVDRIPC